MNLTEFRGLFLVSRAAGLFELFAGRTGTAWVGGDTDWGVAGAIGATGNGGVTSVAVAEKEVEGAAC